MCISYVFHCYILNFSLSFHKKTVAYFFWYSFYFIRKVRRICDLIYPKNLLGLTRVLNWVQYSSKMPRFSKNHTGEHCRKNVGLSRFSWYLDILKNELNATEPRKCPTSILNYTSEYRGRKCRLSSSIRYLDMLDLETIQVNRLKALLPYKWHKKPSQKHSVSMWYREKSYHIY